MINDQNEPAKILTPEILVSGQRVRLLAMETLKSKWTSTIVGSRQGKYLVLESPRVNSLPVIFEDDSLWSINFIRQGRIFNFESRVLSSIARPYPLVFFSFPLRVEMANLRVDKRYPVNIPFIAERVQEADPPFQAKGLLLDISWGGGLAATVVELPDDHLKLSLFVGDAASIEGLVVEKRGSRSQSGTFYTGLSFAVNKPEIMDLLGELISDFESTPLRI
jgi:c-di-GMP-binding flagellar brake protein YcgR